MTYHTDNKIRKYVKGYGFMSFAYNFRSKYGKKIIDKGILASKYEVGKMLKKQGTEFGNLAGKKVIHKSTEATGDLIGSNIADNITSLKVKDNQEPQEQEIIISPEKRQQIINDLRLF